MKRLFIISMVLIFAILPYLGAEAEAAPGGSSTMFNSIFVPSFESGANTEVRSFSLGSGQNVQIMHNIINHSTCVNITEAPLTTNLRYYTVIKNSSGQIVWNSSSWCSPFASTNATKWLPAGDYVLSSTFSAISVGLFPPPAWMSGTIITNVTLMPWEG